jgi:predicted class III extradiol MEMO1 family dioxygenase
MRTGIVVPPATLDELVEALDEALLLDGPRVRRALDGALTAYRGQPWRHPALAPQSYPDDPGTLERLLDGFLAGQVHQPAWVVRGHGAERGNGAVPAVAPMAAIQRAAGVLSPHIDYARGGLLYARTWEAALPAVESAEVVVIFGTDHAGGAGQLTPTVQRYATPWGPLPTDLNAVEALATAVGRELAFAEELHHRGEHSIELAAVWLHWALRRAGRRDDLPPVVAILCGSFHPYVQCAQAGEPAAGPRHEACSPSTPEEPPHGAAMAALAEVIGTRRALVVAAADLAHVGPAFGDPLGLSQGAKEALAACDARILAPVLQGDGEAFLAALRAVQDRYRVCGLPPIYWSLHLLHTLRGGPVPGRLTGYAQCPADATAGSVVSIAGALWEAPA